MNIKLSKIVLGNLCKGLRDVFLCKKLQEVTLL